MIGTHRYLHHLSRMIGANAKSRSSTCKRSSIQEQIHTSLSSFLSNVTNSTNANLSFTTNNNTKFFSSNSFTFPNPPLLHSTKFIQSPTLLTKPPGSTLTSADLQKLFQHQITALQIKAFYPPSHAKLLARELQLQAEGAGAVDNWRVVTPHGLEVSDVWTQGEYVPYNVAVATDRLDDYFDGVQRDFQNRRRVPYLNIKRNDHHIGKAEEEEMSIKNYSFDYQPRLWPLDKLRLELDEVWTEGAGLARATAKDGEHKRAQGGGLPRIMMGPTRWKKGFIHTDQYAPLSNNEGLFSGNIYLQLPSDDDEEDKKLADDELRNRDEGGDLHVWDLNIYSDMDWFRYQDVLQGLTAQDAEMQMILRKHLGEPLKIQVDPGDLVLLCVQKPHCAVGFRNGTRISLQCFLQYRDGERLLIDI